MRLTGEKKVLGRRRPSVTVLVCSRACQELYLSAAAHVSLCKCQQLYMFGGVHISSCTCQELYTSAAVAVRVSRCICQFLYMSVSVHVRRCTCTAAVYIRSFTIIFVCRGHLGCPCVGRYAPCSYVHRSFVGFYAQQFGMSFFRS